jgi:hypothetical protein
MSVSVKQHQQNIKHQRHKSSTWFFIFFANMGSFGGRLIELWKGRIIKWVKREVDATADITMNRHWPEVEGWESLDSLNELGVIPAKAVVVIRMVRWRNKLLKLTRWDLYDDIEIIIQGDFRKPMWNFECRLMQLLSKLWEFGASLRSTISLTGAMSSGSWSYPRLWAAAWT